MRKLITLLFSFVCLSLSTASANTNTADIGKVTIDMKNKASLQQGAQLFMDYCLGCHSVEFQRYNVTARDIGIELDDLKKNYMHVGSYDVREDEFNLAKEGDLIYTAMSRVDGGNWLGTAPPDLSTIVRAKGADYIYRYLMSFYVDETRPVGVNNVAFEGAGMPHVLAELQGIYAPVTETVKVDPKCKGDDCETLSVVVGTQKIKDGLLTEEEYKVAVNDITNFLAYVSEPAQLLRAKYGPWVIGFLIIFTLLAYALNREYWKDVK